jgi:hypothetical protein
MTLKRSFTRVLGVGVLLAAGLILPARSAFAADHIDGFLSLEGRCMILTEHEGGKLALIGGTAGLTGGDHVRLEGSYSPDPGCGVQGFSVTQVHTIWADDNHRSTFFDHLNGKPFAQWAQENGRLNVRRNERRSEPYNSQNYDQRGNRSYQAVPFPEGPHRRVVLVGSLYENGSSCPSLRTTHGVFALNGDLRRYQHGDRVQVSGDLYDRDPNAPCGGPTVVIRSIRGH